MTLFAPDGAANDQFGSSVSLDASHIVVGAPGHDPDGKANAGAAYVFLQSPFLPTYLAKLTALDGAAGDGLGTSVAIHSGRVIAGAPNQSRSTVPDGAAYVFAANPTWQQEAKFSVPSIAPLYTGFGDRVALGPSLAAVTSAYFPALGGRIQLYKRVSRTWFHHTTLATDSAPDTRSAAIALQSTDILAGFPRYYNSGEIDMAGAAFVYPIEAPPAEADIEVYLGEDPHLRPAPAGVPQALGQVWIGPTQQWRITLHNAGSSTLRVTGAEFLPGASPGLGIEPFGFGGLGTLSISPGEVGTITVTSQFDSTGVRSGTLRFTSNDPDEEDYDLSLTFDPRLKPAPPGFRITREGQEVVLRYPQQIGVLGYEVERCTTIPNWESIGYLALEFDPATMTSHMMFRDTEPPPGRAFYRLKLNLLTF
jgi:hypothetical protein